MCKDSRWHVSFQEGSKEKHIPRHLGLRGGGTIKEEPLTPAGSETAVNTDDTPSTGLLR